MGSSASKAADAASLVKSQPAEAPLPLWRPTGLSDNHCAWSLDEECPEIPLQNGYKLSKLGFICPEGYKAVQSRSTCEEVAKSVGSVFSSKDFEKGKPCQWCGDCRPQAFRMTSQFSPHAKFVCKPDVEPTPPMPRKRAEKPALLLLSQSPEPISTTCWPDSTVGSLPGSRRNICIETVPLRPRAPAYLPDGPNESHLEDIRLGSYRGPSVRAAALPEAALLAASALPLPLPRLGTEAEAESAPANLPRRKHRIARANDFI